MADEESIVLGIDLGTTFSAMSYVNHYGKAEIIPNAEGFATTPSVVHFYEEEGCVVGDEAVKMVVIDPENVVRFIKRSMGEEDFVLDFWDRAYTPQEEAERRCRAAPWEDHHGRDHHRPRLLQQCTARRHSGSWSYRWAERVVHHQ
jgi:hypothetical protein